MVIKEAGQQIPIIAVINTDINPKNIAYPIPSNNKTITLQFFYLAVVPYPKVSYTND